jgi:predicted nucleic acid-binding protein
MSNNAKSKAETFADLQRLAAHLRKEMESKKYILLYAYNGTGKTRLSMAFKDAGKQDGGKDTLYFNAFTQDLFIWDNDLENDAERVLKINKDSHFFDGLKELEMDTRIRPLLYRYVDVDFKIDTDTWEIRFSRDVQGETVDNIKISRGEENIFIWCFFLAILQLVIDGADAYNWVKYVYIDDPVSSLDENNAIAVASNLAQLLKQQNTALKTIISSHHTLFFNVLCNELGKAKKYFLSNDKKTEAYILRDTGDTPFFHHVAMLTELYQAEKSGKLYTYHFTILRSILEKSAAFHGFSDFSACIKQDENDTDGVLHKRLMNILSHGNYSLYEPREMLEENKAHFKKILDEFLQRYPFNPRVFSELSEEAEAS